MPWEQLADETGRPYYHQTDTGVTQWERPAEFEAKPETADLPVSPNSLAKSLSLIDAAGGSSASIIPGTDISTGDLRLVLQALDPKSAAKSAAPPSGMVPESLADVVCMLADIYGEWAPNKLTASHIDAVLKTYDGSEAGSSLDVLFVKLYKKYQIPGFPPQVTKQLGSSDGRTRMIAIDSILKAHAEVKADEAKNPSASKAKSGGGGGSGSGGGGGGGGGGSSSAGAASAAGGMVGRRLRSSSSQPAATKARGKNKLVVERHSGSAPCNPQLAAAALSAASAASANDSTGSLLSSSSSSSDRSMGKVSRAKALSVDDLMAASAAANGDRRASAASSSFISSASSSGDVGEQPDVAGGQNAGQPAAAAAVTAATDGTNVVAAAFSGASNGAGGNDDNNSAPSATAAAAPSSASASSSSFSPTTAAAATPSNAPASSSATSSSSPTSFQARFDEADDDSGSDSGADDMHGMLGVAKGDDWQSGGGLSMGVQPSAAPSLRELSSVVEEEEEDEEDGEGEDSGALHKSSSMANVLHTAHRHLSGVPAVRRQPKNAPFLQSLREDSEQSLGASASSAPAPFSSTRCVLAVDVGTTAVKVTALDKAGNALMSGSAPYATRTRANGVVEQDPEDWVAALGKAVRDASRGEGASGVQIECIAMGGQMQDLILCDEDTGRATGPAILYSDSRAVVEAAEVEAGWPGGSTALQELTGNWKGSLSLLPKMMWCDKHEHGQQQQQEQQQHQGHNGHRRRNRRVLLGAHSYVAARMTGEFVTDTTTLATTGLCCLTAAGGDAAQSVDYAAELIDKFAPGWRARLPRIVPAWAKIGVLSEAAATEIFGAGSSGGSGVVPAAGCPVVGGAGDAALTTLGVGAGLPGRPYAYLGTSGWIAATVDRASLQKVKGEVRGETEAKGGNDGGGTLQSQRLSEGLFVLEHPTDPSLVIAAASCMTSGGNAEWVRKLFHSRDDSRGRGGEKDEAPEDVAKGLAKVDALAASAAPGASGVLYCPWLGGERSPFTDPHARGCFIGLSLATSAADMHRAVLEGVAYSYKSLFQLVDLASGRELAGRAPGLQVCGGATKSAVWMQILADILRVPVLVSADEEHVAARGAALLAGLTAPSSGPAVFQGCDLNWFDSLAPTSGDGATFFPPVLRRYEPTSDAEVVALHERRYAAYEQVHAALAPTFGLLAGASRST